MDAHRDLSPPDPQMLLGWRDVVLGRFEVRRRDGRALSLVDLMDDLSDRARSTAAGVGAPPDAAAVRSCSRAWWP